MMAGIIRPTVALNEQQRDELRAAWRAMSVGTIPAINAPYPGLSGTRIKSMKARKRWWFFGPWVVKVVYERVSDANQA